MNIGIDIRPLMTPQRTGVGEYAYELLNALFAIDSVNQYFLFYNSSADVAAFIPPWEQENVHVVAARWPNKMLNASLALLQYPKLDQIVVRCQMSGVKCQKLDYWFSPNLNFTALSPHTKHILTIHDLSFEFFPDCYSPKDRLWHRAVRPRQQVEQAHIILTPSENTKRDVVDLYGVDTKKVHVMYPGLAASFPPLVGEGQGRVSTSTSSPTKYLLYLGAIEARKNVRGVIDAFCLAKKRNPALLNEYKLVLAGPIGWKGKEILAEIKEIGDIQYIGYVAPEDKVSLYQNASLLLYPSLYEGFGFPVLEAMSCGVPVITSNRSSLPEVAGQAAYLVNPMNVSEIAGAITKLLSSPDLRASYVTKGHEQAKKFSWDAAAQQFLSLCG